MMPLTPFQPTGPYPEAMLDLPIGAVSLVSAATQGARVTIDGRLLDGAGTPVGSALIEIWQADAAGRYRHPADPRAAEADPAFWGYARVATDDEGQFHVTTIKPGGVPDEQGGLQAPHLLLGIHAGGILSRCVTRLYFADEPANTRDRRLAIVPPHRRNTLLARPTHDGHYRHAIVLQGAGETVFFDPLS